MKRLPMLVTAAFVSPPIFQMIIDLFWWLKR